MFYVSDVRGQSFLLLQDDECSHVVQAAPQFFRDNDINVFNHPPNSTDLHPIEHMWVMTKGKLCNDEVTLRKFE